MFSSILISGGNLPTQLEKAFEFIPFEFKKPELLENNVSSHPDLLFIDREASIGIADIRNLEKIISLKPVVVRNKVVIIKNAQNLTIEAQNAFLKTLEEPPDYVIFILLVKDIDLLLPTIISRCRIIQLASVTKTISDEELNSHRKILTDLLEKRVGERLEATKDIATSREDTIVWLEKTIQAFRNELLSHYRHPDFLTCHPDPSADGEGSPKNLSPKQLLTLIRHCIKTKSLLEKNINPRLALDNLLLQWPNTP